MSGVWTGAEIEKENEIMKKSLKNCTTTNSGASMHFTINGYSVEAVFSESANTEVLERSQQILVASYTRAKTTHKPTDKKAS